MPTPTYDAATTGQTALAAQINQLLGLHAVTYLYAGTKQASQETDGAAAIGISAGPPASGFTRLAQSFATVGGQTAVGYLGLYGKKVGNGCDLTLELFTNSAGVPGAQVGAGAVTIPADFWGTSNGWLYVPLPTSGLSATTTYWAVLIAGDVNGHNAGDASNYISVEKSNQVSGAATFASSTWTAAGYGFMYREFDQGDTGPLTMIYEDAGARWVWLVYDANGGTLENVYEYTLAQSTGQMRSVRAITNTGVA